MQTNKDNINSVYQKRKKYNLSTILIVRKITTVMINNFKHYLSMKNKSIRANK